MQPLRGISSVGRALAWHARGQRFDPAILHKIKPLFVAFYMFYIYIIYSVSLDKYYIGYTQDVVMRINQHNEGISTFTSKAKDWVLMYTESYSTRNEASIRERNIKKKKSRAYLEWLIKEQNK